MPCRAVEPIGQLALGHMKPYRMSVSCEPNSSDIEGMSGISVLHDDRTVPRTTRFRMTRLPLAHTSSPVVRHQQPAPEPRLELGRPVGQRRLQILHGKDVEIAMLGVRAGVTYVLERRSLIKARRGLITVTERKGLKALSNRPYGAPEA